MSDTKTATLIMVGKNDACISRSKDVRQVLDQLCIEYTYSFSWDPGLPQIGRLDIEVQSFPAGEAEATATSTAEPAVHLPCPFCGANEPFIKPAMFSERCYTDGYIDCECTACGPSILIDDKEDDQWKSDAWEAWDERGEK